MNIKTDSRKIVEGDTFIAIKNVNNDGHNYIDEAIKKCNRLTEIENELRITENNKKIKQEKMKSNKRIGLVLLIIGFMFFIIGLLFKVIKIHELIGIISVADIMDINAILENY